MLPVEIEKSLSLIELQCETLSAAVLSGEPQALEASSQQLRQTAVDFSDLMARFSGAEVDPQLRTRLKQIAVRLGIQREGLLRRSAVVERSLHTLVPSTQKSTYAPTGRASVYRGFAS